VLDNWSTGKRDNLNGLRGDLRVVDGSITETADLERAFAGVRGVFHLAALPSVSRSVQDPLTTHHQNATGTACVLDVARRARTKVIYAGSSSAYGGAGDGATGEDVRENPLSPYSAAKLAGELYCRSFARVYGLPVVVTRFFNVFGPRQVPDSPYSGVVAAFCFALLHGQQPRIDGDGAQSRDFTYITDVVRGCLLAMDTPLTGCHTLNLACGRTHSVLELLEILRDYAGVEVQPVHGPPRTGDIKHSLADITRARELLGFSPLVSFADGLKRTFDWYRSNS
jgi:UDP-glucose 4-epimerase